MKYYKWTLYYFNYNIRCNDIYSYLDPDYLAPASKGNSNLKTRIVVSTQQQSLYLPSHYMLHSWAPDTSTVALVLSPSLTHLLSTFISQDINLIHPSVTYTYSLLSVFLYSVVCSRCSKITHFKLTSNSCWTDWFSDKILWIHLSIHESWIYIVNLIPLVTKKRAEMEHFEDIVEKLCKILRTLH